MRTLALAAALIAAPLIAKPAMAQQVHYSTSKTPVGTLLADPAAKSAIARLFPEFIASKSVAAGRANRFTLRSLKRFRPKLFTDAKLAVLDAEFAKLSAR